jgi:aminoglycoside phosphotransferase (APT) family kinase protein
VNASDHRLQWNELPGRLHDEVAAALGSPVAEAVGQRGGYSPALAARCSLVDGRRVFIKAVSSAQNPDSPPMMRREATTAAALPAGAPAPELLHAFDDGEWVLLVFEAVDGSLPAMPWDPPELLRVLRASRRLGELSPRAELPTVAEQYGAMFTGWRTLAAEGPDAVADEWSRDRLADLAAAESRWESVTAGSQLIHGDLRSDNVLLTADGRVWFVDWTATCIGAAWFDVVAMLPAVQLERGGTPETVLERAGFSDLQPATILPLVAAMAGYFAERGRLADPPGLPTLRSFQRAQGEVTNAWLRRLWDRV